MPDEVLAERIGDVNIFARVVPEQKLRLVQAPKANGEIVAMTGDGVNDSPGPESGQYRYRHGRQGFDVAREARRWCCWTTIFIDCRGGQAGPA